jgi:hypothetical protein
VRFTALKSHSCHLVCARFRYDENAVSQALGYTLGQTLVVSKNLILPDRVAIQLTDAQKVVPLAMAGVLFRVQLFARQKNDFRLQPFLSDDRGLVTILKKDIEAEVRAHYDSGLMDYHDVGSCFSMVEITLLSQVEIDRVIEVRRTHWTSLLAGERERWTSIEQLLDVYRTANNGRLRYGQFSRIRDNWDEPGAEYSYDFFVTPR